MSIGGNISKFDLFSRSVEQNKGLRDDFLYHYATFKIEIEEITNFELQNVSSHKIRKDRSRRLVLWIWFRSVRWLKRRTYMMTSNTFLDLDTCKHLKVLKILKLLQPAQKKFAVSNISSAICRNNKHNVWNYKQ